MTAKERLLRWHGFVTEESFAKTRPEFVWKDKREEKYFDGYDLIASSIDLVQKELD